jgi:hypothetical protein
MVHDIESGANEVFRVAGLMDAERMAFPAMSLREAIEAFTRVAYGERLTFEHA